MTTLNFPRFFYADEINLDTSIKLPQSIAHHLRVLRLSKGDLVRLFNGQGGEYIASLRFEKDSVYADVKTFQTTENELPFALTLAQALPEAGKMDLIIEKASELGVSVLQPLQTERSVIRWQADRAQKKYEHWQAIAQAAACQCGRNHILRIAPVISLSEWLNQTDLHARIVLNPQAEQSLAFWLKHHAQQALTVLVGPEGGFSEAEQKLFVQKNTLELSLGPRVLRTETAGLAAAALIAGMWGG